MHGGHYVKDCWFDKHFLTGFGSSMCCGYSCFRIKESFRRYHLYHICIYDLILFKEVGGGTQNFLENNFRILSTDKWNIFYRILTFIETNLSSILLMVAENAYLVSG
jgi:hypothetical protein